MALYQVDEAAIREDNEQLRKGTWVDEEDERLAYYVQFMGDKKWDSLAKASGLRRSGKSCRLRWLNYLRPNIKHGHISVEEENIILQLHQKWGNKWSKIAQQLPGRTDNEIKNFWRTHLRRKGVQAREIVVLEKAKEELLCQDKIESTNYKKYDDNYEAYHNDHEHRNSSVDELLGTSWDNSSEASAVSPDFAFTNSPYENRFADWISEYSNNKQNESVESSFSSSHLQFWNSGLEYSDSWECSWSLWNMN